MDVNSEVNLSKGSDELIAAIVDCKSQMLEESRKKFGLKTEIVECKVYVGKKNLTHFKQHELWTPAEEPEVDMTIPSHRRYIKPDGIDMVADFSLFKLFLSPIIGDDQIRVVCHFLAPDMLSHQVWFGNLTVLP